MRNSASARSRLPAAGGLGVTVALAVVAYGLFVLTCAMTVERLIDDAPPELLAGIEQAMVTGGLAP